MGYEDDTFSYGDIISAFSIQGVTDNYIYSDEAIEVGKISEEEYFRLLAQALNMIK